MKKIIKIDGEIYKIEIDEKFEEGKKINSLIWTNRIKSADHQELGSC